MTDKIPVAHVTIASRLFLERGCEQGFAVTREEEGGRIAACCTTFADLVVWLAEEYGETLSAELIAASLAKPRRRWPRIVGKD